MGRDERLNIPGATYHVMNRGNRRGLIFEDDQDRRQFLRGLIREQEVYGVETLAGCQMGNHFHLALLTPHGNLSDFMEQFEGNYARYSNWRHHRVGHLFQDRFRAVLIEDDIHLLTALCYIFMNPVVAGLATDLHEYKWSTYAATAGLRPVPSFLSLDWLEVLFPQDSFAESQRRFRELLSQPRPVAAYLSNEMLSVDPEVIRGVLRTYTGEQLRLASLPRTYRAALRPSLDELLKAHCGDRRQLIREARLVYGYKNVEIATVLGLHPTTISKMFCANRNRPAADPQTPKSQTPKSVPGTNLGVEV